MDSISRLPDDLLVKILSLVPTKLAVSTSILSKRWESLWKSVPKLDCDFSKPAVKDFVLKNLPLRAQIIETLCLRFNRAPFQHEDIKLGIGIAVSRCLRELSIFYSYWFDEPIVLFPTSLYTCKSLVNLNLEGMSILVDVPRDVRLPCLKTLQLRYVIHANQDSLRQLLLYCPVLEDLLIERGYKDDNVRALVIIVPTLQRLSLKIEDICSDDRQVIVTPSLKYFKVEDDRQIFSALIEKMPNLEEAYINATQHIETNLESVTSVKRLTLRQSHNSIPESAYPVGIVFDQLEELKICICNDYWSVLIVWFLKNSPKLRVLNLYVDADPLYEEYKSEYKPDYWKDIRRSVPECLKSSLETLEFKGYSGRPEERDFLCFIFKKASCLKTSSISQ